jgi:hypothetical protein
VDERGEALDPSVGKCDHLSSCGYHLTPAAFFREHPERRPGPDWRYEKVDIEELRRQGAALRAKEPCVIPFEVVQLSMLRKRRSDLVLFLERVLDPVVVEGLVEAYRLGTTRGGDVIFWEIDVEGRCRTGKVMKYDRESGHRVKDEAVAGRVNWVHSMLKRADLTPPRWLLPSGWELRQCLFGEHLLREFPEKTVALVESEKTAVICAGLMPGHLWLATGGKQGINDRKFAEIIAVCIRCFHGNNTPETIARSFQQIGIGSARRIFATRFDRCIDKKRFIFRINLRQRFIRYIRHRRLRTDGTSIFNRHQRLIGRNI